MPHSFLASLFNQGPQGPRGHPGLPVSEEQVIYFNIDMIVELYATRLI